MGLGKFGKRGHSKELGENGSVAMNDHAIAAGQRVRRGAREWPWPWPLLPCRHHGTRAPWYQGTMGLGHHGTIGVPWYHCCTMVPWYQGTMVPLVYHGTIVVPWCHGAIVVHGSMALLYHAARVPRRHGTMVPRHQGQRWDCTGCIHIIGLHSV